VINANISIVIEANTMHEFIAQLESMLFRAPELLAEASQPANEPAPDKSNGAERPRRGRRPAAEAPAQETLDRAAIIDGLTAIFTSAPPKVREQIVTFRDAQGVARLKELSDNALPAAAQLLAELQRQAAQP
jgi:hypothetical protein